MLGLENLSVNMGNAVRPRQVFVTQSRLLAKRVQEYYQKLSRCSSATQSGTTKSVEDEDQVLADRDDEEVGVFGLPPKYSMLEDHHFPLFLSFDQLCTLLEADYGLQFGDSHGNRVRTTASDRERASETRQTVVSFNVFLAAYWPHFDRRLTKGLDPALIYSEFLGVIEGSESALGTETGALSREDYMRGIGQRSSFVSQKDKAYDLYQAYRKRRGQLGGYDMAQRTHALVEATNQRIPGPKIDCLYVDEVQDNLLIDIKLLRNLSSNPHGIFMAGDTAQTISAGSSFRFEDLKAFMWRLEGREEAVRQRKRSAINPALFHLAVNYRSHGGIVDCASSIVQLILHLFPDSIDKLKKEMGLVEGPKPIMFSGWQPGTGQFKQFLRGEGSATIDFGAEQVVLVRNDAARNALRAQLGDIGLILTLHESKGLEFDDVLLFNFFEDSVPSASVWRVVLCGPPTNKPGPRFDKIRHAAICSELKHLYVGLTRARNHCWIWDGSNKAEPMRDFWTSQNLVVHRGPENPAPKLGRGALSSNDDWARTGRSLFDRRLYSEAARCYQRASMLLERDIAIAYEAREKARLLQAGRSAQANHSFRDAAATFMQCAVRSTNKQQISCYSCAAECFSQAQEWRSAAEAFSLAKEFELAAKNFHRAALLDQAEHSPKDDHAEVQEVVPQEVVNVSKPNGSPIDHLKQANLFTPQPSPKRQIALTPVLQLTWTSRIREGLALLGPFGPYSLAPRMIRVSRGPGAYK